MLLQQLKLQNIRSYNQETIDFPTGSILLSGDIGSGKSTILLAIEFALFGTSRPDLPAEALLRKGTTQGSAELTFQLENKMITIKRNLKKESDAIKQTSGHIIINEVKKELTAVELKAEIIQLLGYPDEYLTKNKNYIFRYTVYTPQEEMKLILQEDAEIRLDTLRKIFNIDKYKTIRENLSFYLKQFRSQMQVLQTMIEPLEKQKEKLQLLQQERTGFQQNLEKNKPNLEQQKEALKKQQEELDQIDKQQKQFLELQQQRQNALWMINEKQARQKELQDKRQLLQEQILQLELPTLSITQVQEKLYALEEEKNKFITLKTQLQEKISTIQNSLIKNKEEISKLERDLTLIPEKEETIHHLAVELQEKEKLVQKKNQFEELFAKTSELIAKNETVLEQSREVIEKLARLEKCPTCLQSVPTEHKQGILETEDKKIKLAENLLFDLKKKKAQILQQRLEVANRIEQVLSKENFLTKLQTELAQLREKQSMINEKKQQLQKLIQENNQLMQELGQQQPEKLVVLSERIAKERELLNRFTKKQYLEQQQQEINLEMLRLLEQLAVAQRQAQELMQKLADKQDLTVLISEKKKKLQEAQQQERTLAIEQAQLQTRVEQLLKQEEEIQKIVQQLQEEKNKLLRWKELYHWLEEHFLPLTVTIEKQVMNSIHHLFNQLFQEWFSTLMDNENISGRIDDTFSPLIEQNGYDIMFDNLSGGEKTSASLAYRLALNRVINDIIHEIKTKDLLILDEPTDGFSSEQLDKVREVLEKLNLRQTLIVSHENKIESFVDSVIRIKKEGQVSVVN